MKRIVHFLKRLVLEYDGTNAYSRYLTHHAAHHGEEPPLSRKDFFRAQMQRKWQGINRCC